MEKAGKPNLIYLRLCRDSKHGLESSRPNNRFLAAFKIIMFPFVKGNCVPENVIRLNGSENVWVLDDEQRKNSYFRCSFPQLINVQPILFFTFVRQDYASLNQ